MKLLITFLLLLLVSCGAGPEVTDQWRPLNEEELRIWEIQVACMEDWGCDASDLEQPLIQYTNKEFCDGFYAGCAPSDDEGNRYVYIRTDLAYRDEGQYPDFVPGVLNVELFMHEFLHHLAGYCTGNGSHDTIWFNNKLSPCPQDMWKDENVWRTE